jgi:arrestin-related trafficking adapter 4/5/7
VLLRNHDGHYSELRCSLPIHLLSNEVLEETLAATNATRTALLGESHGTPVQEVILPAYHDHIRDRGTFISPKEVLLQHG